MIHSKINELLKTGRGNFFSKNSIKAKKHSGLCDCAAIGF